MHLNTQDLINKTTGKNKSFLKRVAKHQEVKYGNVDIFDATIRGENDIEVAFGENWIRFFFRNDKVYDTIGMGQGHKYHQSIQSVAEELHKQCVIGNL
jgi:hypothetical protein